MVPKLIGSIFSPARGGFHNPRGDNPPSFGALALLAGTFTTTSSRSSSRSGRSWRAIYISEFAHGKVRETLKVVIELLAAIPSIVWGFIGLMVNGANVQIDLRLRRAVGGAM